MILYSILFNQQDLIIIIYLTASIDMENNLVNLEQMMLLNQLYRLNQKIGFVQETIFLYKIYDPFELQPLTTLHAIASKIMDPQISTKIIIDDSDDECLRYFLKVDPKIIEDHKNIKVFSFQLERQGTTQYQWEKKVQIYDSTLNGLNIRIVVIPIPQHFFKVNDGKVKDNLIENMKKEKARDTRLLNYQKLADKQKQWDYKISAKINQFLQEEGKCHLKIFRLEALKYVLTNKTKSISLCGLLEYKVKDPTSLDQVQKELASIFKFPVDLHPQYILHSHPTPQAIEKSLKGKVHNYVSASEITTVYNLDKKSKKMVFNRGGRQDLFNKKHFSTNKQISMRLYSILVSNDNPFMAAAIQKFTDGWSATVSNAIIPIGYAVASIYKGLGIQEGHSRNLLLHNTEEIHFQDLTKMYKQFKQFYLQENVELKDFYTIQKLKISKWQVDKQMIPTQIAELTFLYYFCNLNNEFVQKVTETKKKGHLYSIQWIDQYIHIVCELIMHVNDSVLAKSQGSDRCSNLQAYLGFIKFLLNSTILIKDVTNRTLAVAGNIKVFFQGLKLREDWIIQYMIKNEDNIKGDQSIQYYDLLLMFIRKEESEEMGGINDDRIADDGNIVSIFVSLHRFKADRIAKMFIFDKSRVVEAVRSYCQIILKYDYLVKRKKKNFNKFQIEKKIASLLCVIGLPSEAATIYQRLHMIENVEECLNQMIVGYSGDQIAAKILEFAKFFQDQFAYTLAEKYYQKAYSTAQTTNSRKLAQKNLFECRKRMITARIEDLAIITKYIEQKGSQQDFVKTRFSTRQTEEEESVKLEEGLSQYRRLLSKLSWDESHNEAIL